MRNKILMWVLVLMTLVLTSCSESTDGPTVVPPSWKGFNYVVKREINSGQSGEYEQIERGALKPGDEVRVYAIKGNRGRWIGSIGSGDKDTPSSFFRLRCTLQQNGATNSEKFEYEEVADTDDYDKTTNTFGNPYATFTLPSTDQPYEYFKVEVACQFYFKAFGNQNSLVDYSDLTFHEEPYIGSIFTDYDNFHPMNGGSANSGKSGNSLKYHTIYQYSE